MSALSSVARPYATAMPLSAPSVVPPARTKSPSIFRGTGSLEKSWRDPLDFSPTMSICPWMMTAGESSYPAVPGFLMMAFSAWSWETSSFLCLAKPTK
jgi:hypothetical protein